MDRDLYPAYVGSDLFMHIERKVIQSTCIFPAGARALPTSEWLESRPGAGGGSMGTIRVGNTGFNLIEEPFGFLGRPIETGGQPILHIVRAGHGFVQRVQRLQS